MMQKLSLFFTRFSLILYLVSGIPLSALAQDMRLLPMAPNLVETVFALGAGELVVGIPEYTVFPQEALHLPSAGGYFNPNLERIATLKPDLVLVQGQHEKLQAYCHKRGIAVLALAMEDRDSILDGILLVGKTLEREDRAAELVNRLNRDLDALGARFYREKPVRVLLVLGRTPGTLSQILTAGRETYLTELLSLVGGENIFGDQAQRYPTVSKESILMRNPELILEFMPGEEAVEEKVLLAGWQALASVSAVRHHRIVLLRDSRFLLPGPRIAEAATLLGETLEKTLPWKD